MWIQWIHPIQCKDPLWKGSAKVAVVGFYMNGKNLILLLIMLFYKSLRRMANTASIGNSGVH